ncbi:L-seryl-tRNA(Sec) selenium transferase [Sporomusa ovata DSM 2662]|uniref:L-seryl-tRNA(Sec) selenium transferase n=1 Tax=Sporomusa ovata TaxID=2378 RepID=A0A0U1KRJ4_9FIRM|nr:L-seryl-tRNA(Sec) selenium transferase [Sporomusa ovata]EQB27668.1 L-seryl-tRNA(Sec) selenium transferase [Sporomusa ovata DSM 2662]CQR70021.1 L-seryl-tRNA(Sec) selenium transferase [Sporomusa ovata]
MEINDKLRSLPAIDSLLSAVATDLEIKQYPRDLVINCLRQAVTSVRDELRKGDDSGASPAALISQARILLKKHNQPSLRRVINATGVVLHTNLGRAPLSQRARKCVTGIMEGYSTLEYNVALGERGSRYTHVEEQICRLTGAEEALVVNNNAAAVLLVLSALANGREVIVSRGELVEIGGSFRIPDVLRQSGATLVEVGSTNKTHLSDYEQAIGPNTAAILKVHTSNYCIIGFASQPSGVELAALAHKHSLPVIEDLGSGTILPLTAGGQSEPTAAQRLQMGFDVVTFSGDKLLGASQAGIIAGKRKYIGPLKKHPLLRAIRIDKLSLAALEGTLMEYIVGEPTQDIPVLAMLHSDNSILKERANYLKELILEQNTGVIAEVITLNSPAGGGALPAAVLTGYGVTVNRQDMSATHLENCLRQQAIPIVARIQEGKVIFDVRCLLEQDLADIASALSRIF